MIRTEIWICKLMSDVVSVYVIIDIIGDYMISLNILLSTNNNCVLLFIQKNINKVKSDMRHCYCLLNMNFYHVYYLICLIELFSMTKIL